MISRIFYLFFIFVLPVLLNCTRYHSIYVGVLSDPENEDVAKMNSQKFWTFNQSSNVVLQPVVETVWWWDTLQVTRAVCRLLKTGVHVLVSVPQAKLQAMMKGYSSRFHIPLVSSWPIHRLDSGVSIMPDITEAVAELLKKYKWSSFIFFYDSEDGVQKLEKLLAATDHKISVEAVWRVAHGDRAYTFLQHIRYRDRRQVILATKKDISKKIMSMMIERRQKWDAHFIFLDPVVKLDDNLNTNGLESSLMTVLSLPEDPKLSGRRDLENRWHALSPFKTPIMTEIQNSALIVKDMSDVLEQAFVRLLENSPSFDLSTGGIDCFDDSPSTNPRYLSTTTRYLKKVVIDNGLTGSISFSDNGERVGFSLDVNQVTTTGAKKVGSWSSKSGLMMTIEDDRNKSRTDNAEKIKPENRQKRKITITTVVDGVLLRSKKANSSKTGEISEGYVKDVLDILAERLNLNYGFRFLSLESIRKEKAETLIDSYLKKEEDLLIAPFLSSKDLVNVDVSKPMLTFGLTILTKKVDDIHSGRFGLSPFSIVQVWSYQVWLLLLVVFVVISGANFGVAHYTGAPDRIRSLDTKLSDHFSVCSAFWYTLGSITFRETGVYPRSISHRLLSIIWWCFTLLLFMFYVSSLSFQMLRSRGDTNMAIRPPSAEVYMRNFLDKGYPRIGVPYEDMYFSTFSFAESGLLGEYQAELDNDLSLILESQQEGLKRVRESDGKFAIIVNSLLGQFLTGAEACDTTMASGYLIHKPLQIAFKRGSSLKYSVDNVLMDLEGDGEFRRLYEKWWYGNRSCEDPNFNVLSRIYSNSLSLEEASGVFYLLLCGVIATSICAAVEYFIRSKKMPLEN